MVRHLAVLLLSALTLACGPGEDTPDPASGVPAAADRTPTTAPGGDTPAATGHPRVVFLGTSLAAGLGLDDPDASYVGQVAAIADSVGRPIDAVNAGISGDTSAGGLRRLDWLIRDPLDVLVLELGANDGLRGQPTEALAENLGAIIERTRSRHPNAAVVLAGMEAPPNLGRSYTEAYRQVFADVARAHDAVLVPFLLEGVAGDPELNQADGIHPTAVGHRRMAETLWPYLEDALARADDAAQATSGAPAGQGAA
ncbi:MAG: arylesterase [Longimicrobiales bacterium]